MNTTTRMRANALTALAALAGFLMVGTAAAKLPAPSDEAKAKAAESAAKTAHGNKVANFQLCQSMDQVAAGYMASAKQAGKDIKPATATPPCEDPGPFVYTPPAPPVSAMSAAPAAPLAASTPAGLAAPVTQAAPATPAASAVSPAR